MDFLLQGMGCLQLTNPADQQFGVWYVNRNGTVVQPDGGFSYFKFCSGHQKQEHVQISVNLSNPAEPLPLQKFFSGWSFSRESNILMRPINYLILPGPGKKTKKYSEPARMKTGTDIIMNCT